MSPFKITDKHLLEVTDEQLEQILIDYFKEEVEIAEKILPGASLRAAKTKVAWMRQYLSTDDTALRRAMDQSTTFVIYCLIGPY